MEFMEFIDLVEKTRRLQREYFRFRDGRVLGECKKFEKQVDEFIEKIKHGGDKESQGELF